MGDEKEEQQEFEGFVPTQVKEVRDAAAKFHRVMEAKKESMKTWKEKEEEAAHNLAVLMKKHKLIAAAAGPFTILLDNKEKVVVKKGVTGDDQLKNKHFTDPKDN